MEIKFTAWVINSMSNEGHGLLGRYWWFDDLPPIVSKHLEGCHVALFKTRNIAREYCSKVRGLPNDGKYHAFPNARVEKATVTIRTR